MCCGAIIQSRIKKIYYGVKSDRFGYVESVDKLFNKNTHVMEEVKNLNHEDSLKILQNFFKNKVFRITTKKGNRLTLILI